MSSDVPISIEAQIAAVEFAAKLCDDECRGFPGGLWAAAETLRKVLAEESDAFDDGYKAGYQEGYSRATGEQLQEHNFHGFD